MQLPLGLCDTKVKNDAQRSTLRSGAGPNLTCSNFFPDMATDLHPSSAHYPAVYNQLCCKSIIRILLFPSQRHGVPEEEEATACLQNHFAWFMRHDSLLRYSICNLYFFLWFIALLNNLTQNSLMSQLGRSMCTQSHVFKLRCVLCSTPSNRLFIHNGILTIVSLLLLHQIERCGRCSITLVQNPKIDLKCENEFRMYSNCIS